MQSTIAFTTHQDETLIDYKGINYVKCAEMKRSLQLYV